MKTLGERIKSAREGKGWSQAELAKKAGVSQGTIGNLESGLRKSARQIVAIAEALEVDAAWLESGRARTFRLTAPLTFPVAGTPPPLMAMILGLGKELDHADEATRAALAPLLQRLALNPAEAPHIGDLAQRLLPPADTPATPAAEAEPEQQGYEGWDGINRRTHDEPVKTERRRLGNMGLIDDHAQSHRPRKKPASWAGRKK